MMKTLLRANKNKYLVAMLVFLTIPLSGVNMDIYAPSLPAISHYFHVSRELSQLTITVYLIGLGLMQLVAGSFSDSFGRKKPFTVAMMIYIMTTFLVPSVITIYQLIGLRFIQGISLAMIVVPMRSVITDIFEGNELKKMMTYMTMAWSLGPILAPALGGYLQYYFGWKASFYFLVYYSLTMLLLSRIFLFETSTQQHPFRLSPMIHRYYRMLCNKEYVMSITLAGLLFSLITLFGVIGPFFIQTVLHYSAAQYGQLTLLMGLAWFLGTSSNRFMLQITLQKKATCAFFCMIATIVCMLMVSILFPLTLYNIIIPMCCLLFFSGMLYPSYFIRSVLLFREASASANALFNSTAFLIGGIVSGLGSLIQLRTELPFIGILIVLISTCACLHFKQKNIS